MQRTVIAKLSDKNIDDVFLVSGWVEKVRNHGGVIFIDLKDFSGLVQIVVDPQSADLFKLAESIRMSYVLNVRGSLCLRPEGTLNSSIKSGNIELVSQEIEILSKSKPLPFQLDDHTEVGEDVLSLIHI